MKKENKLIITILCVIILILSSLCVTIGLKSQNKKEEISEQPSVLSTVEQQLQEEEAIKIETKYCNLYYPQNWESQLRTEIVEDGDYTVKFYGTVEGKEEQHIFSIVFGETEHELGSFKKGDETVKVCLDFEEHTMNEEWTEEEKNTIYAMQEDVNYLIGMWEKEGGFMIAK